MESKLIFDYFNKNDNLKKIEFGLKNIPDDKFNQISIISDYKASDRPKGKDSSNISAYLVLNYEEIHVINQGMNNLRKRINLPENSFFDYKSINEHSIEGRTKIKNEENFLEICQKINGSLLVFFEEERLNNNENLNKLVNNFENQDLGKWKPHILNQMINTFFHINFIRSKINSINGINWLSDEDSRLGNNDNQRKNSLEIFKRISQGSHISGRISIISQCDNKTDKQFYSDRDLKSVPDLTCGRLFDYIQNSDNHKDLSGKFFNWFRDDFGNLNRKLICIRTEKGKPSIKIY